MAAQFAMSVIDVTVLVVTLRAWGFALAKYRFAGKRNADVDHADDRCCCRAGDVAGASKMMYVLGWMNSYWAIVLPGR